MTGRLAQLIARQFHWIYGAFVILSLAYALALMPVAFGDQFTEVVRTFRFSLVEIYQVYFTEIYVYFRPLEYFWRELLLFLFGQSLFSYNVFGICLLVTIALLFLLHCRAASARDALAAAIALSALFGHHAFAASMELNQVITNLVVVAALASSLLVLGSSGGPVAAGWALLLSLVAVLTKEIGIVVPIVLVLGWLSGLPGVRRRTAIAVCVLATLYLCFRLYVVGWLGQIDDPSYGSRGGPITYLSNAAATLLNILVSEPKDGRFDQLLSGVSLGLTRPWKLAQIAAPMLTYILVCYVTVSRGLWRPNADPVLRPWLIVMLGALMASAMLGFFHTADYFGVTALPTMAAMLYLSLRQVMGEIEDQSLSPARRSSLAVLVIVLSATWTLRIASNAFFIRDLSAAIQTDWVESYHSYQARYDSEDLEHHLGAFRDHALGTPIPSESEANRYLRGLFGSRHSISR